VAYYAPTHRDSSALNTEKAHDLDRIPAVKHAVGTLKLDCETARLLAVLGLGVV
jgi:hypothetical protein